VVGSFVGPSAYGDTTQTGIVCSRKRHQQGLCVRGMLWSLIWCGVGQCASSVNCLLRVRGSTMVKTDYLLGSVISCDNEGIETARDRVGSEDPGISQ
jgi:hypothetical protein